jgi:hypothetical protein
MGIFDRILGGGQTPKQQEPWGHSGGSEDDQAVARYRYMLRTASPETIEQTHAEAFAKLTPDQRRRVLNELSAELPEAERDSVLRAGESPTALARAATRAEIRQPGTMERTFGRIGGGPGLGGMMAGTFLSTMAGVVLGTALAQSFLGSHDSDMGAGTHDADTGSDAGGFTDAGDAGGGFEGGFDV